MKKNELIEQVAKDARIKKAAAKRAVESVSSNIIQTLKSAGKAPLAGLGIFKMRTRKARTGRNPKTGESLQIPERKTVTFRASRKLKKQIQ